jgi:hypothetical protein
MRRPLFLLMIALLLLRGWAGEAMATDMAAGHMQRTQHVQWAPKIQNAINNIADSRLTDWAGVNSGSEVTSQMAHTDQSAVAESSNCAGHGEVPAVPPSEASQQQAGSGACELCAACQACHTVALSPDAFSTASSSSPATLPRSSAAQFASAPAALGQKPPIS